MADDILCFRCMRWHPAPVCDHDPTLPCAYCGQPRGYRWNGRDRSLAGRANQCFRCWLTAQPVGSLA